VIHLAFHNLEETRPRRRPRGPGKAAYCAARHAVVQACDYRNDVHHLCRRRTM
jgi:hypothetical protein